MLLKLIPLAVATVSLGLCSVFAWLWWAVSTTEKEYYRLHPDQTPER